MCPHFTNGDDTGCWGECAICHKRVGYVTSEQLRRYADNELAAIKQEHEIATASETLDHVWFEAHGFRAHNHRGELLKALEAAQAELAEARDLCDRLKLEARINSGEAPNGAKGET
jgi:hypothetical protein